MRDIWQDLSPAIHLNYLFYALKNDIACCQSPWLCAVAEYRRTVDAIAELLTRVASTDGDCVAVSRYRNGE